MRKILITLVVMLILIISIGFVVAKPAGPSAANGLAHAGKASQLYLYEKDPVTWDIVEDGAWGKMVYSDSAFVFNGHGLEIDTSYTLIYYPDINNKYQLDFLCTSGCSGTYTHTMSISTFDEAGFSGIGSYNANPGITWTVEGVSTKDFTIKYDSSSYIVTCHGDNTCTSNSGQKFKLTVTDIGPAVWPHPIGILGEGVANNGGNVHIAEPFDFTSIPWGVDTNSGAKIWLVLSGDVDCDEGEMAGWNPEEYLFEYDLI